MGGCVSLVMERRNDASAAEHALVRAYRAYGDEAVLLPQTETPGYSGTYRMSHTTPEAHERDVRDFYSGPNWVQQVQQRCGLTPDAPALGYRTIEKIEKRPVKGPDGKERTFDYYHCSGCKTISYREMWECVEHFGRGLAGLGIAPQQRVSIYEETRWEWLVSIYGIWTQNMIASTVYANLGEDALAFALEETDSAAIVCNGKALPSLMKLLRASQLRPTLIYLDDAPGGLDFGEFTAVPWKDVVAKGKAAGDTQIVIPTNNDDLALIMYTSGTTGNPKGVMHTHGSVAAGIRALNQRLEDLYKGGEPGEIYCAYLPMAHILEFAIINIFVNRGTLVGFGNPRTLTDGFAIPHGDLREFKPKVIIAVPRVFDTIKKTVEGKLPPRGSLKRHIFDRAFESRRLALQEAQETPYWNDKVFAAARQVLGGNVYGMLSGGGPLSEETQEFINVVCGGPLIIQGWGLTETVCCGATQRLGDLEPYCVGQLVRSEEMRLKDTDDYKHTDRPEPRGELCVRGPFLFKGYYKQPELTKEVMDADGWFHTGDVGAVLPNGTVRLVGRVKALAKNCLGEYIALENMEAIYSQNPLCLVNGVCVLVHPARPYIAALVLTDHNRALRFAKESHIEGSVEELLQNPAFHTAAAASLVVTAKSARRQPFECVKCVRVLTDEWTPENGLVTPTTKLRRTRIEEHYKDIIASLFTSQ
ncbi:fatty acyl CoA synthetase 2 [Strigomonas culicis]|uniref:Fatty acyl CoA synthetase 2 n=1 Tax=Strigomonas culicis TaxID=28005 RepID=S9U708_9TRYP|nr:fatty acyl CoA synthetase 2 [Strigomonas culicis]EPY24678.1 fatty acyl CoA synthetase 2 [Strigomonas culicis]|eukprot:EPY21177.1 fatty acyl CoA synthetase 2 [Strigomonas culicis]